MVIVKPFCRHAAAGVLSEPLEIVRSLTLQCLTATSCCVIVAASSRSKLATYPEGFSKETRSFIMSGGGKHARQRTSGPLFTDTSRQQMLLSTCVSLSEPRDVFIGRHCRGRDAGNQLPSMPQPQASWALSSFGCLCGTISS